MSLCSINLPNLVKVDITVIRDNSYVNLFKTLDFEHIIFKHVTIDKKMAKQVPKVEFCNIWVILEAKAKNVNPVFQHPSNPDLISFMKVPPP